MAILSPLPQYTTRAFSWDSEDKVFMAQASDLGWNIEIPLERLLGQAWDDAADLGFTLLSAKTGKAVTVAIDHIDDDDDFSGGWRYIKFTPCDPALRDKFKVVIFND